MLSYLKGVVGAKTERGLIIINHDIGYEAAVPVPFWRKAKLRETIAMFTHEYVREDIHDLYGFETMVDLSFFKKLISISGVGPKVALSVMSLGTLTELQIAIAAGNVSYLTAIPGVGTKIAQKIVLEMKGKLDLSEGASPEEREAIEALESLGYNKAQARDVLRAVPGDVVDVGDRVRAALKNLGQKVR